jgi:predicted nuclease with TOPRIM domain
LAKNTYKVSRQDYNKERRRQLLDNNYQQIHIRARPEIITLITATIREENQRLVKQHKNSLSALESLSSNQKSIRLKHNELKERIQELPMKIQGLEDLRDLWRALQKYAEELNQLDRVAHLIEKDYKNIVQTLYIMVYPRDQRNIDLFVECFKTQECIQKWKELIGTPEKWKSFFT